MRTLALAAILAFSTGVPAHSQSRIEQLRSAAATLTGEVVAARGGADFLRLAFSDTTLEGLPAAQSDAGLLEERGDWSGFITTVYMDSDDPNQRRSGVRMRTAAGSLDLSFSGAAPAYKSGDRVSVTGVRVGHKIAVQSASVTAADSGCSPLGEQKVAVILTAVQGDQTTYVLDDWQSAFFGESGLGAQWRDASYGKAWVTGEVIGPLFLDHAYDMHDPALIDDALMAASRQIDLTRYQRYFIVYPGTGGTIGHAQFCAAGYSAAVLRQQIPAEQYTNLALHEGGHELGLNEAESRQYPGVTLGAPEDGGKLQVYNDPFTPMGDTPAPMHYNARQKWQLGWLGPDEVIAVDEPGVYRIAPLGSSDKSPKALRIARPDTDGWLWLEYRQPLEPFESSLDPIAFTGALIHYEDGRNADVLVDSSLPGRPGARRLTIRMTDLLDFTPHPGELYSDMWDPVLPAGATWSDPWTGLSITVTAMDPSGLTIEVGSNACVSLDAYSRFLVTADAGAIQVRGPGCSWSATASQPWVTLEGPTEWAGDGEVRYEVAANTGSQRSATISIGGRAFTVVQAAPNQASGIAVIPRSGSGYARTFTFTYWDPRGADYISKAGAEIKDDYGPRTCGFLLTFPVPGYPQYTAPAGGGVEDWTDSSLKGVLGASSGSTTIEGATCILDLQNSSFTRSGNELYLRLAVTFRPNFDGEKTIRAWASDISYGNPGVLYYDVGSWTIDSAPTGRRPNRGPRRPPPAGISVTR